MYITNYDKRLELDKVHARVGLLVLSTLYSADKCLIILNSFVDEYGSKLLDEIASSGTHVILVHDSVALQKGSVKKPKYAKSYTVRSLRIHDKIYIAISNDTIIIALSSANLLRRDLYFNINHYTALIYPKQAATQDPTIVFLNSIRKNQCNEKCSRALVECIY